MRALFFLITVMLLMCGTLVMAVAAKDTPHSSPRPHFTTSKESTSDAPTAKRSSTMLTQDLLTGEFAPRVHVDTSPTTNRMIVEHTISTKNLRPFYTRNGVFILTYTLAHEKQISDIRLRVGAEKKNFFEYIAYPSASERITNGMHTISFNLKNMSDVQGIATMEKINSIEIIVNYPRGQMSDFSPHRLWAQEFTLNSPSPTMSRAASKRVSTPAIDTSVCGIRCQITRPVPGDIARTRLPELFPHMFFSVITA